MKRLLPVLAILTLLPAAWAAVENRFEVAEIDKIHDGDTFRARFFLLEDLQAVKTVRLLNCDAFELRNPGGREALAFTRAFLSTGTLTLLTRGEHDNFGRLLADIEKDGVRLSDALTSAGLTTGRFREAR